MLGREHADGLRERCKVSHARSSSDRTFTRASGEMKPIILLTGKSGQVGAELLRLLPQLGEVIALGQGQLAFRILLTSAGQYEKIRSQRLSGSVQTMLPSQFHC